MQTLNEFSTWLLRASWQASVLVGLVLLVQWLFRNKLSAGWRYALWLLVVARLVMPVSPQSAVSIFNLTRVGSALRYTPRFGDPLGSGKAVHDAGNVLTRALAEALQRRNDGVFGVATMNDDR